MRNNTGIIGPLVSPSINSATGVHNTFGVFNSLLQNSWPRTVYYKSLSFNSGTILENVAQSITLTTEGIVQNTTLFWTILHVTTTASDFAQTFGGFTQSSSTNTGSFVVTTKLTGDLNKSTKTFQIQIRTGSTSGPVVYTSGVYSIPATTLLNLNWSSTNINEGGFANLNFQLGNCGSASTYTFSIANSGTITSADISGGLPTTTSRNPGIFTEYSYTLLNDFTTEGTETLTVQLSYNGFNIGSPQTLTVSDTSQTVTATVTPSATTKDEDGTSVTFTVNTTNFTSGTLYWTIANITGSLTTADFTQGTSGSFSVSSSTGSVTLNIAADETTEGGIEQFQLQVRLQNTSGTVIGTSSTVTINDTSLDLPQPSYVTLGSKAPVFGAGGASTHPPSGWTSLVNISTDDSFVSYTSPFSITINNTAYSTHYVGSNSYITWGAGSTAYSSLSGNNPSLNKLLFGGADNSFQRVSYFSNGTSYTRMRYEGNGSTSGTLGSPGIVVEITFFNPANYDGKMVIEILVGYHNRTNGATGIASTSAYLKTWTIAPNTAYVLVGNSSGTSWQKYDGYVNNSGY